MVILLVDSWMAHSPILSLYAIVSVRKKHKGSIEVYG